VITSWCLGMSSGEIGVPITGVLTGRRAGSSLRRGTAGQLAQVNLFCRVNPQQKHRILLALKRLGHTVASWATVSNDAPALHAADVGISVDGAADVAARGGRSDPTRTRPFGGAQRHTRRARCGPERSKYVLMGSSSKLRQHVQHGRRGTVPAVPADAADPDPAEQSALRRFRDRDPVRPGRSGGNSPAGEVGRQADRSGSCWCSGPGQFPSSIS